MPIFCLANFSLQRLKMLLFGDHPGKSALQTAQPRGQVVFYHLPAPSLVFIHRKKKDSVANVEGGDKIMQALPEAQGDEMKNNQPVAQKELFFQASHISIKVAKEQKMCLHL
jgi:hypothetical protein